MLELKSNIGPDIPEVYKQFLINDLLILEDEQVGNNRTRKDYPKFIPVKQNNDRMRGDASSYI